MLTDCIVIAIVPKAKLTNDIAKLTNHTHYFQTV